MVGARPSRRLALLKGSHFPAGTQTHVLIGGSYNEDLIAVKTLKLYQSCPRVRV